MSTDDSQVPYLETTPPATYRILESVTDRASAQWMEQFEPKFSRALRYFDDLAGQTVTVAHLKPSKEYVLSDPIAVADPHNNILYFDTAHEVSYLTIFHELAHLEIYTQSDQGRDVPVTSEEYCSIYAVALMDEHLIDRDRIAYLGHPAVHRNEWPEICQRALEYREDHRNYVQKVKEWLETEV
ncbi:hypothetical protein [Natronosalvus amylolyticus]|uniref:hypothetical protein n=1 Tax=Natronosalvus amylolyticus TaxID=2961994 RepID=UPI0020C95ABF|nr:hypothetical protein [Natronosalvus amylolyticus]